MSINVPPATSQRVVAMLAPLILASAGCSGPKLEFAEVEGKVTLNKKPLAGVIVRFYPVSEGKEQLPYATGMTDEAGVYTLMHQDNKPGALVGKNHAVVYWPSRDLRGADREGNQAPSPGPPIPLEYTVPSQTPFNVEVKPGESQTIDLPLKD